MRRTAAAALLVAVAATACQTAAPPPPPAATTLNIEAELDRLERDYLDFLRAWSADQPRVTAVDVSSNDELLEFAYTTCIALDDGLTHEEMAAFVVDQFADPGLQEDFAVIIGTANATFCPWEQQ